MPEAPGQSDLVEVSNADRQIPEKGDEDRRAQNWSIAIHPEQIDGRTDAETCRRQSHPAQCPQAYPEAPWHLIAEVRARPESFEETDISRIKADDQNDSYDDTPQSNF